MTELDPTEKAKLEALSIINKNLYDFRLWAIVWLFVIAILLGLILWRVW